MLLVGKIINLLSMHTFYKKTVQAIKFFAPVALATLVLSLAVAHVDVHGSAVMTSDIADGAVTSVKLATSAVSLNKVANNAINHLKILNGEVGHLKIATNAIDNTQIIDGTILPKDLSPAARTFQETIRIGTIAQSASSTTNIPLWLPALVSNAHLGQVTGIRMITTNSASPADATNVAVQRLGGDGTVTTFQQRNLSTTPLVADTPSFFSECANDNGTFDPAGDTSYQFYLKYTQGTTGAALNNLLVSVIYQVY